MDYPTGPPNSPYAGYPVRRPNTAAWRVFGCIFLTLLFVGLAVGINFAVKFFNSGTMQKMVATVQDTQRVMTDLVTLKAALDSYKADHKAYPPNLDALIPKYLPDKSKLTANYMPGRPKFFYTPPPPNAPASFTLLQIDMAPPFDIQGAPPWTVKVRLDGRLDGSDYKYTPGR